MVQEGKSDSLNYDIRKGKFVSQVSNIRKKEKRRDSAHEVGRRK